MPIAAVTARVERFALARPYTIAFKTTDAVENFVVRVTDGRGLVGLGVAAPEPHVTGETPARCAAALLDGALDWLVGRDPSRLPLLARELAARMPDAPSARAAVDVALHDLAARGLGRPLVDVLGRAHDALPTSITIGIKGVAETLAEAAEYVGRGFTCLKVKTGHDLDVDLERLRKLRERHGDRVRLRVDANQGYAPADVPRLFAATADLAIEFFEQPSPPAADAALAALPEAQRRRLCADESLVGDGDALRLAAPPRPYGIFNIKLMKCGGIRPALRQAAIAETAGIDLMWGCMDESRIGIAAALHAAFAAPATRYLDLDGSLDLARDVVDGGFVLDTGIMRTLDRPGLGVDEL